MTTAEFTAHMQDPEFAAEYRRQHQEREENLKTWDAVHEASLEVGKVFMGHALAESEETGEPGFSGWGRTHQSAEAIERQRVNRIVSAHWRSPGEEGLNDQVVAGPPLPNVGKTFGHPEAGLLHLTATGSGGWVLRIRGIDYGIGPVGRRERQGDELRPSRRTLTAAAAKALEVGPDSPPDALMFMGGNEEVTVMEYMRRNGFITKEKVR